MLTIAPGVDGSERYYAQDNYYTKEQGVEHSYWAGNGAALMGLPVGQAIDPDIYLALWRGEVGDRRLGRVINGETVHRPGWDLTFSAPKSLSILSEVFGVAELREIHERAVRAALARAEGMIDTRLKVGGESRLVATNNGVFACFTHDTSRNLDCQLHTHAFLLNMTWTEAGWRSIQEKRIFQSQKAVVLGTEYRIALARFLKEAGYKLVQHHKDARFFEIDGVPQGLINAFSTRSAQIEQWFQDRGIEYDSTLAKAVSLITRKSKETLPRDELRALWLDIAQDHPFDLADTRQLPEGRAPDAGRGQGRGRERPGAGGGSTETPPGSRATPPPGDVPRNPGGGSGSTSPPASPVAPALPVSVPPPPGVPIPAEAARVAVARAVRHWAEREMGFRLQDLRDSALRFALGDVFAHEIDAEIQRRITQNELQRSKDHADTHRKKHEYWTTRDQKKQESGLIELVVRGKDIRRPLHDPEKVKKALEKTKLNSQQRQAMFAAATSTDRNFAVQGDPGVGKTTALREYKKIMTKAGYDVIGLAPSYQAVAELSKSLEIPGMTVDRFIVDPGTEKMGRPFRKQIWIVDESSMLSTDRMIELIHLAEQRNAHVLWSGDHQQLESVGSGRGFWHLQQAGVRKEELDQWVRPKTEYMKEIFASVMEKEFAETLSTVRVAGNLRQIEDEGDALKAMAQEWVSLGKKERLETLVVTPTNQQAKIINSHVRAELLARGEIDGKEQTYTSYRDKYMTSEEVRFAGSYSRGDIVRFSDEHLAIGKDAKSYVLRQEYFAVEGVNKETNRLALRSLQDKRLVYIDPSQTGGNRKGGLQAFTQEEIALAKGDRVRWADNKNEQGLRRNDELTVLGVDKNTITATKADGARVTLAVNDRRNLHFVHDYAKTAYGVQGVTYRNVMAMMSSWRINTTNARSLMVALTRATHDAKIYTDNSKKLVDAVAGRSGSNTEALTRQEFEIERTKTQERSRAGR